MSVHGNAVIKLLFFIARGSCYRNCCDARVFRVTLFNPGEDKHSLLRIRAVVWGLPDRRHVYKKTDWWVPLYVKEKNPYFRRAKTRNGIDRNGEKVN